jgi:cytochrome c5
MKQCIIACMAALVVVSALSITSCKKAKVSFTNPGMKVWFDTYCASCHAAGKGSAAKWLYDPEDFNTSIKDQIALIYDVVYIKKSMPPTGVTQAELTKFNDWYNAGYSPK